MKREFTFALAIAAAFAAGCTELDFDVKSDEPAWSASQASRTAAAEALKARRINQVMPLWSAQPPEATGDYRLGPGDELTVAIFALDQPGQTSTLQRTVSAEGRVSLPWVRGVNVGDMTVPEAEDAIRAAYAGDFLQDPQVTVTVDSYMSKQVVVTGAVNEPGIFPLVRNRATLIECLALADGLSRDAGQEVILTRVGQAQPAGGAASAAGASDVLTVRIGLPELLSGDEPLLNVPVLPGDVITVPPQGQQYVSVVGHVKSPGAFRLDPVKRMDALAAVAFAGGLTPMSRADNSFLIRQGADGQQVIPVDLEAVARADLPPLYMQPGDTLIVGTSFGAWLSSVFSPSASANISASAAVLP
jgi:polysaccharide export outer membrane protein